MQTVKGTSVAGWLGLLLAISSGVNAVAQSANVSASAPAFGNATSAPSTPAPPPSSPAKRSAAELEKLAMPIALHPDPLIAIILPASAYPLEIVQAARFVRDTNNLPKVDQQAWDANVKAVAKFPELIAKMDADLEWTVELGQAFVDDPKELMDTIQALRAKAQKAGTLQTTPQQIVTVTNVLVTQTNATQVFTVTNQIVQVQPANPQVVYVPTYTSTVYYPPPSYVYDPVAPLVTFGFGIAMGAIIANNCDWYGGCVWWGGGYHGDVDIDIDNDINIDRPDRPDRPGERPNRGERPTQQKWQPDQNRLRSSGVPATAQGREARGWGGGSTQPAQRPTSSFGGGGGARPATQPSYNWSQGPSAGTQPARTPGANAGQRPATPSTGARSTTTWQPSGNRSGQSPGAGARPAQSPSVSRPSQTPSTAFGGVNNGAQTRNFSDRGASSRSSGISRSGGGGGARGGGGRGR